MKLTKKEMQVIYEALQIAHSKYDIDVKVSMHNYEENSVPLIKRKAEIEELISKLRNGV